MAPAVPTTFVVPDEVGKVLQAAQDEIQVASNDPLHHTSSSDATGAGRSQVIDSGRQVCSQDIAPGTVVDAGVDPIDVAVVRISGSCP